MFENMFAHLDKLLYLSQSAVTGIMLVDGHSIKERKFTLGKTFLSSVNDVFVACVSTSKDYTEAAYPIELFTCINHQKISAYSVCDGVLDCSAHEDEENCSHTCTFTPGMHQPKPMDCQAHCRFPECQCSSTYFQCVLGGCVPLNALCNGVMNCPDGSDESACGSQASPEIHSNHMDFSCE